MSDTYSVSLVDRRTGRPHRVNGTPLAVLTRAPEEAAQELLRHRDRSLWDVRVDLLATRAAPARTAAPRAAH